VRRTPPARPRSESVQPGRNPQAQPLASRQIARHIGGCFRLTFDQACRARVFQSASGARAAEGVLGEAPVLRYRRLVQPLV